MTQTFFLNEESQIQDLGERRKNCEMKGRIFKILRKQSHFVLTKLLYLHSAFLE